MGSQRRGVMLMEMAGQDIREQSFQNVLDTILKPAGVKVGGYPEDIFLDLEEEELEKWTCNICYLVVKDAKLCDNRHLFCHTCIFAWSMTYAENSQNCPVCRNEQRDRYSTNKEVDHRIGDKRVKCPEKGCSFRSPMKIFLMHSHGKTLYSNDGVNLESLRPARPPGSRLLVLPTGSQDSPVERVRGLRDQLHQGRAMLHQMMMLLHLEMQLRQQALVSYAHATDADTRLARLDEVLALNEQLNEVGGILSALLSDPVGRQNLRASSNLGQENGDQNGTTQSTGRVHIVQATSSDRTDTNNANAAASNSEAPTTNEGNNNDEENESETSSSESNASTQYGIINRYARNTERNVPSSNRNIIQRRHSHSRSRENGQNTEEENSVQRNSSNDGTGSLLSRRNSSQVRNPTQSSAPATNGQNASRESIVRLNNAPQRSQSNLGITPTLPPISGTSPRASISGLPSGSNTHQDVLQTLSASVPNRSNNLEEPVDNVPRLRSEQSSRTIIIDTSQQSDSNAQSERSIPAPTVPSSQEIAPNSTARRSQNGEQTNVPLASNQPARASYAPQRRFSRQNSVTTSLDSTSSGNNSVDHANVPRQRSDGGARMMGVATRRSSVSRSRPNQTDGGSTSLLSSSGVMNGSRPSIQRRNSREVSSSGTAPENRRRVSLSRSTSGPGRSNGSDHPVRPRRRSEIAQELMKENGDS